jgi:CheY-like chemotaxis protein
MANILLVEDDEFLGPTLQSLLESSGHTVTLSSNGALAIEQIESAKSFDCILTDLEMPVMNGLELIQWATTHKTIPIILMTGFFDNMNSQVSKDLGAVNFLYKPFSISAAENAIASALGQVFLRSQKKLVNE